jgi:RNA polymerase sigma-70 factor (ECF subfamily)
MAIAPPDTFEHSRERLRRLAYRLLGSVEDADDLLQELYIRWHEADTRALRSTDAWLTTVMTRLCIDRIRARRRERDTYPGSWLPEPLLVAEQPAPDAGLDLAGDLSLALLVVLEQLAPEERAAFLLHDAFDYGHAEIGTMLGKSEAACRQLVSRARRRIHADRPRFQVSGAARRRLLERFLAASRAGDAAALAALIADDATLTSDGGGKVRAALNVIRGRARIVRLLTGLARKHGDAIAKLMLINGELGIASYRAGRPAALLWCDTDGIRITALYRVLNPDKLRAVPALD